MNVFNTFIQEFLGGKKNSQVEYIIEPSYVIGRESKIPTTNEEFNALVTQVSVETRKFHYNDQFLDDFWLVCAMRMYEDIRYNSKPEILEAQLVVFDPAGGPKQIRKGCVTIGCAQSIGNLFIQSLWKRV